jgi:hypothetical protein
MLFPIKSNDHTVEMSLKMEMSDKKKGETLMGFYVVVTTLYFK